MNIIEPTWQSDDGRIQLWQGDCRELLPMECDAVVTDPPYGIGEHGGACRTRGRKGYSKHENKGWDNARPDSTLFRLILEVSRPTIIWGGNYFADMLPPSMGWLYWRKLMGGDFSDGELAWTSMKMALREFTKCPKGIDKEHPCQKPTEVMVWCLGFLPTTASVILDPFMGSGTTGIACIRTGRQFRGIELASKYFQIAVDRIKRELSQPMLPMSVEQPPIAKEQELPSFRT